MKICNLCALYNKGCDGRFVDSGEIASCEMYEPKRSNVLPEKRKPCNPNRDLGCNNSVRREHLDMWKESEIPSYIGNGPMRVLLQRVINKIEHKFNHCENFIDSNKEILKLSYYANGYYNGRARAFEDVIGLIKDILAKAYNEELEANH